MGRLRRVLNAADMLPRSEALDAVRATLAIEAREERRMKGNQLAEAFARRGTLAPQPQRTEPAMPPTDPSDPPSPGIPPSLISDLQGAAWSDSHFVLASGSHRWLRVASGVWGLGQGSGALGISNADGSALLLASANGDGSVTLVTGGKAWLHPASSTMCELLADVP